MEILQIKDFGQFKIEKVQAFMTYDLKNQAFKFDSKENFAIIKS